MIPESTGTYVYAWDTFKLAAAKEISRLTQHEVEVNDVVNSLELSRNAEHGSLALPVPKLTRFSDTLKKQNLAALAQTWAQQFETNDYIKRVHAAGPFLNFEIHKEKLIELTLTDIHQCQTEYGSRNQGAGKRILVEFSSPNIAKPFHAGHLRSTIIGNFVSKLHQFLGFAVTSINYLGDWGKQYGLLAVGYERYGSEEELKRDPIRHLFDVYVKINADAELDASVHDKARAYFKRMEQGDVDVLGLWRRFRELSIVKYQEIYARLNVAFDVYSGESLHSEHIDEILRLMNERRLLVSDRGAEMIDLKPYKMTPAVIVKSDGTTLYLTRDIAAALNRKRVYEFERLYYVAGAGQGVHFAQLFKILDLMGFGWYDQCHHVNFGMVKGMKTRKGDVVFLEDILNEAKRCMHEVMQRNQEKYAQVEDPDSVADIVGLSAVLVQDMQARRVKDYEFEWTRILSFEGDTGPYLQFTHARLASIERRQGVPVKGDADLSLLSEDIVFEVCEKLARFPEILSSALDSLEPCTIVNYLFGLCHSLSNAFDHLWVRGADPATAEARMLFYWASRTVLHRGLLLLGLTPLERM